MSYAELSKQELVAELERIHAENRSLNSHADDRERLLQKLSVHQVELELQNRELREAQGALEESRNRYADLYDFAPVAYLTLDGQGRIQEINLTGATMLGQDRDFIVGKPFVNFAGMQDASSFWKHLRRCEETRGPVVGELCFSTSRTGPIDVQVVSVPVLGATGHVLAFRTAFQDITLLRKAERQALAAEKQAREAEKAEGLLRVRFEALDHAWLCISDALRHFATTGLHAVLQAIVEQARVVTGAEYAAIGVAQGPDRPFDPWVASGIDPATAAALGRPPRAVGVLGAVVREDKTIHLSDLRTHPTFQGFPPHHPPMTSFIGIPIRDHRKADGILYVANKVGGGGFDEDDVRTAEMLAFRAGIALELALLHELEERERAWLSVLAETSNLLSSTLDQAVTLDAVARLPVPWMADYCTVYVVQDNVLCAAGFAHADRAKEASIAALQRRFNVSRDSEHSLMAQAWRTAKPVLITEYTPVGREASLPDPSVVTLAQQTTSAIVVPVMVRGEVLAVIAMAYADSNRHYKQRDVPHAQEVALRAGFALENARLFEKAQAAIQDRNDMLAVVSHDLRNPLSSIRLSAGLLRRTVGESKPIDVIVRSTDRMDCLIEDLLQAATIREGRFTVRPGPEDVRSMVDELVAELEPLAATKFVRLKTACADGIPLLICDRQRILQVLVNLTGNAVKFAPEKSDIGIDVCPCDGGISFAVSDSGPGIAAEDVAHVFDRYWKHDRSGGRAGVGLGLYITKGIIEAHGGRIEVEPKAGEGTTFRFTLPV